MKQMKRILSFVLALTMLVSMFSVAVFSTSAEETTYVLGDADMDGVVNIFDVTYIQMSLARHEGYEIEKDTIEFAAADADADGVINIFDVTYIQRYLAKYDDGYGIGEEKTFGEVVEDPTTPTEDESVEGYYLVGDLNGVALWDAASLTPDRKLKDADGDGIYTLDYTFYMGDELKVVEYDGTSITRWFKSGDDPDGDKNYTIGSESKTGLCTLSFDPTGSQGWSYIYFTVQQKAEQPTEEEPTEEQPTQGEATDDQPTQATEETEAETTAPVGGPGYYLVGALNGVQMWSVDANSADRKLSGPDEKGIYTLDWTFYMNDQVKVAYYDGTSITKWFKDGMDNHYSIGSESKTGLCTLSFDPTGSQGWSYEYLTVQKKVVEETEAPTAEETVAETEAETAAPTQGEATDDDPTVAETEAETVAETEAETEAPVGGPGYYLVGALNGTQMWYVDDSSADRKLSGPDENGIYTLDWTFYMNDEVKVAYYDGTSITKWFKDGMDNHYSIGSESKTGLCVLSFDPTASQGWSYEYLTVQKKEVVETEAPTEEETVAETEAPTVEPTEEPTEEPTQNEATPDDPTVEPTQGEATPDDPTVAPTEEPTVEETEPETEEPTEAETEAPKAEAGYYLVGELNGENFWFVDATAADRMLTANAGNEGEYMLKWTFDAKDAIKVVYFDGETIKTWYNDGGDNYTVGEKKAGPCTLYFRPEGNESWSYYYFTVIADTVEPTAEPTEAETEAPTAEPTEEPTQAPTEAETEEPTQGEATPDDPTVAPTEEPTVEETEPETEEPTDPPVVIPAGYYLVGTLGGENYWFVDENSADRMLEANEAAEGEYMLDWTFVDGDEIKVAYFDGTEITQWFKGDGEANYTISAAKAGENTIYFRPEGNADWSYTYFTVPSHETPVDYHLVGYINGADYGCEGDYANVGDYKFVDGKLVVTFAQDSYVFMKTSDNAKWYMFESYVTATTGTLKNTSTGTGEKMFVPGNVEVTFTLVDNGDDTFTLSYTTPQAPTEETLPESGGSDVTDPTEDITDLEAGYYLVGQLNGKDCWDVSTLSSDRLLTDEDGDGVYTLKWTFYMGDKTKVAYFDGTSITQLFKPDGQPTYDIGSSSKTGLRTLSFQPAGTSSYSYTYFTIK